MPTTVEAKVGSLSTERWDLNENQKSAGKRDWEVVGEGGVLCWCREDGLTSASKLPGNQQIKSTVQGLGNYQVTSKSKAQCRV